MDRWQRTSLAGLSTISLAIAGWTGWTMTQPRMDASRKPISVAISGAVQKPNVYTIESGKRVRDIIQVAGGLTKEAELGDLNLELPLEQGMQVHVGVYGDPDRISQVIGGTAIQPLMQSGSASGGSSAKKEMPPPQSISINEGNKQELMRLPRVGEVMAQRIIDYRTANGGFKSIEDLSNVKGIGSKTLELIRPYVKL